MFLTSRPRAAPGALSDRQQACVHALLKHPCHGRMMMLVRAVVQITPFSYIWEKLWGVHDKPFWLRCVVRTPLRECSLTFPLNRP